MRRLFLFFVFVFGGAGCQTLHSCKEDHNATGVCESAPSAVTTVPPTKVEVQTPETITVKAPSSKVVIEQPAQIQAASAYSTASPQVHGPGFGGIPQPMTMVPMTNIGTAPLFGSSEVREKNSVGLMFTSINIPIPWLRLKVIPEGSEVTTRSQLPPANQFGGVPMQAVLPQMPMMPMQQFGGSTSGQMVYTGTQMVPVQGVQAIQVPTGNVPINAGGINVGGVPNADSTADTVEKLKAKLKECEDLQNKLKALHPTK